MVVSLVTKKGMARSGKTQWSYRGVAAARPYNQIIWLKIKWCILETGWASIAHKWIHTHTYVLSGGKLSKVTRASN